MSAASDRVHGKLGRLLLAPGSLREFLQQQRNTTSAATTPHIAIWATLETCSAPSDSGSVRRNWWGERHVLSPEEFWDVQAVFDSDARATLTDLDQPTQRQAEAAVSSPRAKSTSPRSQARLSHGRADLHGHALAPVKAVERPRGFDEAFAELERFIRTS